MVNRPSVIYIRERERGRGRNGNLKGIRRKLIFQLKEQERYREEEEAEK